MRELCRSDGSHRLGSSLPRQREVEMDPPGRTSCAISSFPPRQVLSCPRFPLPLNPLPSSVHPHPQPHVHSPICSLNRCYGMSALWLCGRHGSKCGVTKPSSPFRFQLRPPPSDLGLGWKLSSAPCPCQGALFTGLLQGPCLACPYCIPSAENELGM